MRIPGPISGLYGNDGPFATAYLDASRAGANAAHEVELRWRELADRLHADGADDRTLAAMGEAVDAHRDGPGERGQVIVGAGGEVLADLTLPHPPRRPGARWAPLPHLMPYFAQLDPATPYVLAVADRSGADVYAAGPAAAATGDAPTHTEVQGGDRYPLHKTSTADWSERHFQQRVENAWAANARDVAEAIGVCVARSSADLVILAGDPRARTLIADGLAGGLAPHVTVVHAEAGSRAAGASEQSLDDAVHDALLRHEWRRRRRMLGDLNEALSRGGAAVQGVGPVVEALRRAQVETLVLSDDPSSTARAWIGHDPTALALRRDELLDDDVAEDRLDAALLRAVAGTGAGLIVTPNAHHYVREGIAALLRYTDTATP